MPSRPWESLGLRPRDPLGPGRHYFFFNNALAGILILILMRYRLFMGLRPNIYSYQTVVPICRTITPAGQVPLTDVASKCSFCLRFAHCRL